MAGASVVCMVEAWPSGPDQIFCDHIWKECPTPYEETVEFWCQKFFCTRRRLFPEQEVPPPTQPPPKKRRRVAANERQPPPLTQSRFDEAETVARARLPTILEEAEEALGDSAVDQMSNVALKQGLTCLERLVASRTRYQISGMTDECFANERWFFLLERAKLKAGIGMTRLDPVTELALITAQTVAIAHARNTSVVLTAVDLDTPAPPTANQ
eukprot:g31186.t1